MDGVSPSPDYPQEIHNCGNVNIEVSNKNILDTSTVQSVKNDRGNIRQGFYCKIPKTGRYYIKFEDISQLYYFGYSNDLSGVSIGISNTNSTTQHFYDFTEGQYFVCWNSTATANDKIMICLSSTATDYVEHQEQTITFPLSEGQRLMLGDYLADDGIHHVRGQVVLDGSEDENWNLSQTLTNTTHFVISDFTSVASNCKIPSSDTTLVGIISNYFKEKSDLYSVDDIGIDLHRNKNFICGVYSSTASTIIEFKNWLSNNPITVEYELEEETIEPYTSEQQIAYNQIKELNSYSGGTHIYSTDETSPIFKASALLDLNTLVGSGV